MRTATRVVAYAAALAVVYGAAAGVGAAIGPVRASSDARNAGESHQQGPAMTGMNGAHDGATDSLPAGLAVSADGYTITPVETVLSTATTRTFRFTIIGPDGARLTSYTRQHDKDLHLILVRRDTGGYQHLHPVLSQDGIWSVPVKAEAAGDYRAIADFVPGKADAHPVALGVDLHASGGQYNPQPVPPAAATATVDGFTVNLNGDLQAGVSSQLRLTITRDGRAVTDLQPYLGAYGHLVALRVGDLAYLHAHPNGEPGDGHTMPGPTVSFMAEVPTVGTYRLYLDFKHAGTVHTAEFTAIAAASAPGIGAASQQH